MERPYVVRKDNQYVVRMDRRDGKSPATIFGPACLRDCAGYVKGWYQGFDLDALEIAPELAIFRLYIEEVVL